MKSRKSWSGPAEQPVRKKLAPGRLCVVALLVLTLLGCRENADTPPTAQQNQAEPPTVHLGIGSMITPKEGYIYYYKLGGYLQDKLEQPVNITDRGTYDAFNKMLKDGMIDVAFVCGGPYIEGKENFGLELLVEPETISGATDYYSLILVPADSPAQSLKDLRGKNFAFTDPKSNSGYLVPSAILARMGENPQTFFAKTTFTYAHDRSVRAVAEQMVDGSAVDSLVYDYMVHNDPHLAERIRILHRSDPYGIPPVVVRPDIDPALKDQLRNIMLNMDKDEEGAAILKGMLLNRFVPAQDSDYDTIRRDRTLIQELESP